jgi:hypothetical protein
MSHSLANPEPAPPVPKEVLQRMGLAADEKRAINFLRGQAQYQWAHRKAAEEVAKQEQDAVSMDAPPPSLQGKIRRTPL